MFKPMRRFKQELSQEKCIEILKTEQRGVLSLIEENGYPYGIPMNHWYCEENGRIYFHGAREGQKINAIKANNKASYCVFDAGYRNEGEWALNISSVVAFGKIRLVEDEETAKKICVHLVKKFTDDEHYLQKELEAAFSRVQCLEFIPTHITGKLVNES